jgi:uridine kinase
VVIDHDSYYFDQGHLTPAAQAEINYDHPDAFETTLLIQHLEALRRGESVDVPIYDFVTHTRRVEHRRVAPAPVILVEGILVFVDAAVREQMDIKISSTPTPTSG